MNESDLYKELGSLIKDRDGWKDSIPCVVSLLAHESVKIQAKTLWLLGERWGLRILGLCRIRFL